MIHILHISDLHFVKNAAAYNTEEVLLREAAEKVRNVPQGKKLLIVTGDFHNFWDRDYQKAETFLKRLVSKIGLDMKQDVFVIPGNHDVGNDTALEPLLQPVDPNWKSHQKACLKMLKDGDKSYIEERLLKFLPYSAFLQHLEIYDTASDEKYPVRSHVRCWRDKLNILHLNTALIADGTKKDEHMTDVDAAANPKTWEPYYDSKIPSIAIGHNNYYDIKEDQRHDLAGTFALRNVSAYLCGDRHQIERNPEYRTIPIQPEPKHDIRIPNLVAARSIADGDDNYSEVGFCWHCWDEKSDEVSVEFRKWTKYTGGKTERDGEGRKYDMRHEKPVNPNPKEKPDADTDASDSSGSEDNDTSLKEYLFEVLKQKRKRHPSFQLLEVDEIDNRLYPNIKEYKQIEPCGKVPSDSTNIDGDSCPIWAIIRDSWSATEHRSVVILGEGGIGKTVALFSIADTPDGSISVPALYIPMYELVDKDGRLLALDEYITKRYRSYSDKIDKLATETWKDRPQLMVLLDGFNEISFSLRRGALVEINEWHESHPGAQLIAVSRPMDGLNLMQELAGNPLPIELAPLKEITVRAYLREAHRRIPAKGAPIWEDLQYPLFLNMYVKNRGLTKNPPAGYPLSVKNTDSGGSLIWNFLQRELLRHKADKSEKAENWVLRCAVANEYILPFLAYRMVSENRMNIGYKLADLWTKEALNQFDDKKLPKHLTIIWNKFEQNHGNVPKKDMFPFDVWRNTVLRDSGVLVSHEEQNFETGEIHSNYIFMHQHFRDCLAGLYLVNQAETTEDNELPEVWRHGHNHLVLDYAAELMEKSTAERLWEINRIQMQYNSPVYKKDHSATFALLELQRRRKPIPKDLDFTGMDIEGLSLARYMGKREDSLPLFQEACYTYDTKLDRSTFQNEGHRSFISCILTLPNDRIVSAGDTSLRVWDPSTGQCLHILEGHTSPVYCMKVLPDGRIVSAGGTSLRVWDPSTEQCLQILEGHTKGIGCVAVLPDGRIVSGSWDHSLRVWDSSTGQCLHILEGHTKGISCVAAFPDGRIVSGSEDTSLRVWDPSTGQCLHTLEGHTREIWCISVLSNDRIVSGSWDHSLRIWDSSTGQCLQILNGHTDEIWCMAVLSNDRIVSGSWDHSLRVWDSSTGQCLHTLEGHPYVVRCVAALHDGRIVSGLDDHSLRVWDSSTGQCLQILEGHTNSIRCVAALPDGRIVSGSRDHSLRVWDPLTGQCLLTLEGHARGFDCVAVLPDGWIVSASLDNYLRVWDPSTGQCLHTLEGHASSIHCVTALPDGRIVSGIGASSLRVWDPSTGQCLNTFEGHTKCISCVVFLTDGRIVSGSEDTSLRVWNPSTGQCLHTLEGHTREICCMAVLSNDRIVSGSWDHSLRVWDSSTGQCLQTLEGHTDMVSCVAALSDGRIVSGSWDHSLRVWDPSTGQCLLTLNGHTNQIWCLTVLSDDRIVSDSDHSLRVWDSSTGQCLMTLEGHTRNVNCVVALPDGRIISGSSDGTMRIWDSNTGECLEVFEIMDVDVSKMDLSNAILTKDLAKLLWQNGATISETDFKKYVCPSHKEEANL